MTTGPTMSMNTEVPDAKFQRFFQRLVQGGYHLFAPANSGLALRELDVFTATRHPVTLGVMFGLVFGIPLGILSFISAQVLDFSKLGIIAGSVVSGIAGWILLGFLGRSTQTPAFAKSIASGERIILPKTKVACTIGPDNDAPQTIRELISSGMRIARLNFSHGTQSDHGEKSYHRENCRRYGRTGCYITGPRRVKNPGGAYP